MGKVPFLKMHGLGNDFVVLDARHTAIAIDADAARVLADRHTGIGCDQLIVLEAALHPAAHVAMRIRNPDGGEAEACGNATRCIAWLLHHETGARRACIETLAGLLEAEINPDGTIAVDMGPARTGWRDIPLAREMDTACADLALGPLSAPVCTNIGNPHATFFVDDAEAIDLAGLGPALENHPLFPHRANIGVAAIAAPGTIRLRVWERGAGITRACGSGACAALVGAHRRGLAGRRATVRLDGGNLDISWREDEHVIMTGPAALSFKGSFDRALLADPAPLAVPALLARR
ncbi:MAG: diaminopimelate epimerase [Stellaceae bacterium]